MSEKRILTRLRSIKTIYATAMSKGLDDEALHRYIKEYLNIDSIANADSGQLTKILNLLGVRNVSVEIPAQIYMIYKRAEKWGISKESIDAFIHKRFKVKSVYALNAKQLRGLVKVVFGFIDKKRDEWIKNQRYVWHNNHVCRLGVRYKGSDRYLVLEDFKTSDVVCQVSIPVDNLPSHEFLVDISDGGALLQKLVSSFNLFKVGKEMDYSGRMMPVCCICHRHDN